MGTVQSQSQEARMLRARAALHGAYQRYLDWQGEWDGNDGGDASTFIDWVRDELGVERNGGHLGLGERR